MPSPPPWQMFRDQVDLCPKLEDAMPKPCRPRPCATCPYRKDRKPWMDAWRWLLNVFRIQEERVQQCHNDGRVACAGAVVCLGGGSPKVFSPFELSTLDPASLAQDQEDMLARYAQAKALGRSRDDE